MLVILEANVERSGGFSWLTVWGLLKKKASVILSCINVIIVVSKRKVIVSLYCIMFWSNYM